MHEISNQLHFAEHSLQEVALIFMAIVYTLRVVWLVRFKAGKERQPATGLAGTTPRKGILYSWANIAMPWAMESTRKNFFIYVQFAIFHIGVVSAITLSFFIPYAPNLMANPVLITVFQISIGGAFIVGVMRIIRRSTVKVMRHISTPDDYFSLLLLTVWFGFAFFAVPNQPQNGETALVVYFWLTAFFLVYVPFSKISHYLYYPFTRYYFGKSMGYRGVYPMVRKG